MILSTHGLIASQIQSYAFLLDTYTSAAAAYSLRKLRSAYTGNAIRVRRSSDNTETNIGFSSSFGLDTTTLSSFCSGTNGFVTTWYDQSGNGRNATQTTAANQPQIVSSGTVINLNGKPIVTFNGTSQVIQTSTTIISTDFSVFGTAQSPSDSLNGALFTQYSTFDDARTLFYLENNTTRLIGVQIGAGSIKTGTPTNLQKLYYYNRSSSSIEYADNNASVNTATNGTTCQSAILRMGSFDAGSGDQFTKQNIQELIIYTSSKSSSRTGISSNINSYYGIY
jgi:hypothetical protein